MKIHQTIGIVAGVHALAFLLIFVSPGCSSTAKTGSAAAADPAPTGMPPLAAAAPAPAADSTPLVPTAGPSIDTGKFYAPTRPDTAAAQALTPASAPSDVAPAETYSVKSGDSLSRIAHRHHVKVSELAAANNLRSTSPLHVGQKLIIPGAAPAAKPAAAEANASAPAAAATSLPLGGAPGSAGSGPEKYTVKPGDKLSTIARHFGMTTGALAAENNISDPRKIRPGQVLTIPAGGSHKGGASAKKSRASRPAAESGNPAPAAPAASTSSPALEPVPSPDAPAAVPSASDVPIIRIDGAGAPSSSGAPSSH